MSSETTTVVRTRTKTIWSETQFELLYAALGRNGSDHEIRDITLDLVSRDFPPEYLYAKVQRECGMMAGNRFRRLVAGIRRR